MRLLIDTHILIWLVRNDPRLTGPQRDALADPDNAIMVSPVVAYELTNLQLTKRIPITETIGHLQDLVGFELPDLPSDTWKHVAELPDIHRDPIDRMLIAHAVAGGMTLVTADAMIRRYPVNCV